MTLQGTISFDVQDIQPVVLTVSEPLDRPLLAVVLRNFDRIGKSRPSELGSPIKILGLPDTTKLLQPDWVDMTKPLQLFWYNLLKKYGPLTWTDKEYLIAWHSLTHGGRAFTNGHGWNNGYADYIGNLHSDAHPMGFEPIVTGGNVVALASLDIYMIAGKPAYKVFTLDSTKPPETWKLDPWFVYKATISRRDNYDEGTQKWQREDRELRFPQLGGKHDVPVPLWSKGGYNFIAASRVRLLGTSDPLPAIYVY